MLKSESEPGKSLAGGDVVVEAVSVAVVRAGGVAVVGAGGVAIGRTGVGAGCVALTTMCCSSRTSILSLLMVSLSPAPSLVAIIKLRRVVGLAFECTPWGAWTWVDVSSSLNVGRDVSSSLHVNAGRDVA